MRGTGQLHSTRQAPQHTHRCRTAAHRQTRSDALSAEVRDAVQQHYLKNSRESTRARDASFGARKGQEGTGKRFLECTLQECYHDFCTDHPELSAGIGRRRFEMLKPSNIKILGRNDRIVCACQRHVNAKLLLEALLKFRHTAAGADPRLAWAEPCPPSLSAVVHAMTCGDDDHPFLETDIACINGQCTSCGVDRLDMYAEVRVWLKPGPSANAIVQCNRMRRCCGTASAAAAAPH